MSQTADSQNKSALARLITEGLEQSGQLPKFCEISKIGPLFLCSLHSGLDEGSIIREDVFSGMDTSEDVAIIKALVECSERFAFLHGIRSNSPACRTERSDGFAAYPQHLVGAERAKQKARENAYYEAIERYVWASWWDKNNFGHTFFKDACIQIKPNARKLLYAIQSILPIQNIYLVRPWIELPDVSVDIFFLVLKSGGVVSGGAAGKTNDETVQLRALGELSRHVECARRILTGAVPVTFYEQRLAWMATSGASEELLHRLELGHESIRMPDLAFDTPISYPMDNLISVHRCLFRNQPPFIGGRLERLCL